MNIYAHAECLVWLWAHAACSRCVINPLGCFMEVSSLASSAVPLPCYTDLRKVDKPAIAWCLAASSPFVLCLQIQDMVGWWEPQVKPSRPRVMLVLIRTQQ